MGDDCINLQMHGSARVYRLSDRASFLSCLESQLRCCGVAVDFSSSIPLDSVVNVDGSCDHAMSGSPTNPLDESHDLSQPHSIFLVRRYRGDTTLLASHPCPAHSPTWRPRELCLFGDRLEEREDARVVFSVPLSDLLVLAATPPRQHLSLALRLNGLLLSRYYFCPRVDALLMDLQGLQLAANRPLLPLLPLLPPRHNLLAALWTRKTVTTDRLHGDGFMEGVRVVCAGQPLATMTAGEAMCVVRRAVAVAMTAGKEELLPASDEASQASVDSNAGAGDLPGESLDKSVIEASLDPVKESMMDTMKEHGTNASTNALTNPITNPLTNPMPNSSPNPPTIQISPSSETFSTSTYVDARYCLAFLEQFLPQSSLSPEETETALAPLLVDPPPSLQPALLQLLAALPTPLPIPWVSSLYPTDDCYLQLLLLLIAGTTQWNDCNSLLSLLSRFARFPSLPAVLQALLLRLLHSLLSRGDLLPTLQRRVLDTGLFLRAENEAFFGPEERRPLARLLLLFLSHQHLPAISLLTRSLPREFHKYLLPTTKTETVAVLASEAVQNSPQLSVVTGWRLVASLEIPAGSWNAQGLFGVFDADCHKYWLEWSQTQRLELRNALGGEIEAIAGMSPNASWNHGSFTVRYPSYQSPLFLDDYFLPKIATISVTLPCSAIESRIPADLRSKEQEPPELEVRDPRGFLLSLYARYCRGESRDLMLRCLRVTAVRYVEESEAFFDADHVWKELESGRNDMLLGFAQALLRGRRNALGLWGARRVVALLLQRLREAVREAVSVGECDGSVVHNDMDGDDGVTAGDEKGDASDGHKKGSNGHDREKGSNGHDREKGSGDHGYETSNVDRNNEANNTNHDITNNTNNNTTSLLVPPPKYPPYSLQPTTETPATRILRILDILYRLLTFAQTDETPKPLLPLPSSLHLLATTSAVLTIVNTLFVDSPRVAAYTMTLLLSLIQIIPAVIPLLADTPLVDAIFLQPAPWNSLHVELLRHAISRKEQLQGVLPEPVLMALRHAEAPMFIRLFFGNTDSERIVWTNEMRAQLFRSVTHHVANYCILLRSHLDAPFVATPLAHLSYPPLRNDIYCANLYLRRWIETGGRKLPNKNAALVFQAIRREWIHEGKRGNVEMTEEGCLETLGMDQSRWEKEGTSLCEERFWQKWVEKGTDRVKLQRAYDLLSGVSEASNGPISWRLLLLVEFQKTLYLSHPVRLQSFAYPAYDLLVTQLQMLLQRSPRAPEENALLAALLGFLEVTLRSCLDNAPDFAKRRGFVVLRNLLQALDPAVQQQEPDALKLLRLALRVLVQLAQNRSLAGALTDQTEMTALLTLYVGLPLPLAVKTLLLRYLTEMARWSDFRLSLLHTPVNVLVTVLPLLFEFDAEGEKSRENAFNEECHRLGTQLIRSRNASLSLSCDSDDRGDADEEWESPEPSVDETDVGEKPPFSEDAVSHADPAQEAPQMLSVNQLCEQAVRFLAALLAETTLFSTLLARLLTKSLCDLLSHYDSHLLLSILVADRYESPFIIWNAAMRSQLLAFLHDEFLRARQGDRAFVQRAQLFVYEAIQDELLIADVYVRVYVEQKPEHFLKDQKFFAGILAFLRTQILESAETPDEVGATIPPKYVQLMLQSLLLLLAGNPALTQDLGAQDLRVFLTFLQPTMGNAIVWEKSTVQLACNVMSVLFSDSRICDEFVQNHFQEFFLSLLFQNETPYAETVFSLLAAVSMTVSSTETLLFSTGIWVFFLYSLFHFSGEASKSRRFLACQVLSHWCRGENKARFRVTFRRYLPSYIVDAFTETPVEVVQLVDGTTVTPEILWDPSMRVVATAAIDRLFEQYTSCFHTHRELQLEETVRYAKLEEAFFCGGVLIRIYLSQPGYRLRKPEVFLEAAMPMFFAQATALREASDKEMCEASGETTCKASGEEPYEANGEETCETSGDANKHEEAYGETSDRSCMETHEASAFDQLTQAIERVLREEPLLSERFMEKGYRSLVETWKQCLPEKADSCVSRNCCRIMSSVGAKERDDW